MTRSPLAILPSRTERLRPSDYLYRAATVQFVARATKAFVRDVLKSWPDDSTTPILLKAAADPATLGASGWAGDLAAAAAVADAIVGLAPASAAAGLIARGLRVSLDGVASISIPQRLVEAADAGTWLGEGSPPIRVGKLDLDAGPTLAPFKLGSIATFTNELATHAVQSVEAVVKQVLSEAAALALDAALFSDTAASSVNPAGLLKDVSPGTAATGGGASALAQDVATLVGTLAASGAGVSPVFICAPGEAAAIKMLAGARFDYPVLASAALASGTIIAVEALSFVSAFDAVPEFSVADQAVLHEEDTSPAALAYTQGSSPNIVAAPARSLFQTNCSAIKMILRCAWGMRASGHVQYLEGLSWGTPAEA